MKRQRRTAVIAAAVVLIALGALGNFWLVNTVGSRVQVVAVSRTVAFGQKITRADVQIAQISQDPAVRTVRWTDVDSVIGQTATTTIPSGSLLNRASLASNPIPGPGQVLVGISAAAGHYPEGLLQPGDHLVLITTSADATTSTTGSDGSSGFSTSVGVKAVLVSVGSADVQGHVTLNVVVGAADGPSLAAPAAAGQIVVILEPAK